MVEVHIQFTLKASRKTILHFFDPPTLLVQHMIPYRRNISCLADMVCLYLYYRVKMNRYVHIKNFF